MTAGPASTSAGNRDSGSAAVRKNVTALFGDLVGSTSFEEQVDPEAARAALAPYFEILRTTVEDHAGTVVKFTGDGVLAVFGIPEVAEDDALRAVAAGQALQRRFVAFAEAVREQHDVELGLRVGINTGELVIDDNDADMVGDVLNTAARLEAACQPGRVMVGEDTWRLTRNAVSYEVLDEVRVKGKIGTLATFQVADDDSTVQEDTTPFVGRHDELTALRVAFDDTISSSKAHLVTVIGDPGVGKTRLAAELRAGIGVRSFDLRFERRGSTTFTPVVELLRDLTGSGSADDIAVLVADHAEAARLSGALASLLGHEEARSTEESFWAVRRLFEHLASNEPLVIVVDDIQWAEPLFWDLLDHLVEWTEAQVLLVALARPELRELRPELTQAGRRVSASVSLEGLDADLTRELAARLLGTTELPADLIERLPDSTEGNPLFVRELVHMLVDDGVLARTDDRWHLTIDVDAIEVPPTVLSLLASRVERLPRDERRVVELASVIGTEFDRGLLSSIGEPDVATHLPALIDRLHRKDLIEPSGTWAGDEPVYRFHHVLVRDAAYRRLLKVHRADLHERVGRYLDAVDAHSNEYDVAVAFHFEQVHRYRSELGTVDIGTRELAAQATRRLQAAAEQALAREDLAASGSYAERALHLTDEPSIRSEMLLVGCEALLSLGDVARGAALVDELASVDADERLTAWADCFQAQLWSLTNADRLSEAAELADDAADRLDALEDQAGVAKARLVRANTLARLGRVGDCEAELDRALGAARAAGDRRRTVAVLGAAPLAALWGPSPVARAGGRCLDVLRLLRITTTSPAVEATSIRCQGMLEALRGRFDSAHDKFETSRTTARDLGLRQGLYETELFEGFAELLANDPVAAEPHLRLARDGLGALGIGADAGQATALLARALLRQGKLDEADALANAALESAGENLQTAVASRSVLAEIRSEQGLAEDAEALVNAAITIVEQTDITLDHAIALRSAVRVAERADDQQRADRHRSAATLLLESKGVTGLNPIGTSIRIDPPATTTPMSSGEQNEASLAAQALGAATKRGDAAAVGALFTAGYTYGWHEPMRPTDSAATIPKHVEALIASATSASSIEVIALRGERLALLRGQRNDGTTDTHFVLRTRNGLIERSDWFGSDQLAEATAELERQWASDDQPVGLELSNDAWLVNRRMADAWRLGQREAYTALLSEDFRATSHQLGPGVTLNGDRATVVELMFGDLALDSGSSDHSRLLAVRGDSLALIAMVVEIGAAQSTIFTVSEVSNGRAIRADSFAHDQLTDAHDLLNRRWAAMAPHDVAELDGS